MSIKIKGCSFNNNDIAMIIPEDTDMKIKDTKINNNDEGIIVRNKLNNIKK